MMRYRGLGVVVFMVAVVSLAVGGIAWLAAAFDPVLIPPANSHAAPSDGELSITFDQSINAASVHSSTFQVQAMFSGRVAGEYSVAGGTAVFDPDANFLPGELVQATVTSGTTILAGNEPVTPTVWSFRVLPAGGSGELADSGQGFQVGAPFDVALGDLDGDGKLDAVSTHSIQDTLVWLNSGGAFSMSMALDTGASEAVALGDLNGDHKLDAYFGNSGGDQVWLNQGAGVLSTTHQLIGNRPTRDVALGDLDGDGDLDAVTANDYLFDQNSYVYLNDGHGYFTSTGQGLVGLGEAVAIGDIDSDGDLDLAFGLDATGGGNSTRIWLNDGRANFTQGTGFGAATQTMDLALGDLNDDLLLDIVTANFSGSDMTNRLWLNSGSGLFNDSGQDLSATFSRQVDLGDLNADGDLDVLVANSGFYEVWTTDGLGSLTRSEYASVGATADLGDLDGDGDLDALLGDINPSEYRIWTNTGSPGGSDLKLEVSQKIWLPSPEISATFVISVTNEGADLAESVRLTLGPLRSTLRVDQYQWTVPAPVSCSTGFLIGECDLGDLSQGEQVVLEVEFVYDNLFGDGGSGAHESNVMLEVSSLGDDVYPSDNLAYLSAVLYNCDPIFGWDCTLSQMWCDLNTAARFILQATDRPPFHLPDFYAVRDSILSASPKGRHYIDLYYTHDAEIGSLVLGDGDLLNQAINTLTLWQPNLEALVDGTGDSAVITAEQVAAVDEFLTALSAEADPTLQQVILEERAKLPPAADFIGLTMEEARGIVVGYGSYLPTVSNLPPITRSVK